MLPTIYIDDEQYTGFSPNRTRIIRALGVDPPNPDAGAAPEKGFET